MTVIIDGTVGLQNNATDLSYTGTLTGSTGVVNIGAGQIYKDASGNVGIGTASPTGIASYPTLDIKGSAGGGLRIGSTTNPSYIYTDAAGMTVGTANAQPLTLFTSGLERARIDSSGNLVMASRTGSVTGQIQAGRTSSTSSVNGYIVVSASSTDPFSIGVKGESATQGFIGFFDSTNTEVGRIGKSGSNTTYVTSSDYRLKDTIAPMTGALEKVAALKPVTYKWKIDGSDGQGFIAHELAEVEPGCVTGEKDAVDAEGKPQYQGIDTSFLVATLTAAIQEQQAMILTLTDRITALEAK